MGVVEIAKMFDAEGRPALKTPGYAYKPG